MSTEYAAASEPAGPRSLRSVDERARRRAMLDLPHVAPPTAYTAGLQEARVEGRSPTSIRWTAGSRHGCSSPSRSPAR